MSACIIGVVGGAVTLIADISLTLILCISLFIVDPIVAAVSILVLGAILVILNKVTHLRSHTLGAINRKLAIQTNQEIESAIRLYRELTIASQIESTVDYI